MSLILAVLITLAIIGFMVKIVKFSFSKLKWIVIAIILFFIIRMVMG